MCKFLFYVERPAGAAPFVENAVSAPLRGLRIAAVTRPCFRGVRLRALCSDPSICSSVLRPVPRRPDRGSFVVSESPRQVVLACRSLSTLHWLLRVFCILSARA